MNTQSKALVLGALALISTGSFLPGQTATTRPDATPAVAAPRLSTGTASGPRRGGATPAQTRLEFARVNLMEAKRALEAAAPDKGGFREKALQNVNDALKNVEQGMAAARTEQPRGTAVTNSIILPGASATPPAK